MNQQRLRYLFKQYEADRCSEQELQELSNWFHSLKGGQADFNQWIKEEGGSEKFTSLLYSRFNSKLHKTNKHRPNYWRYTAAAAILVMLGLAYLFVPKKATTTLPNQTVKVIKKIGAPGGNRAILTLANGSHIDLDSTKQGAVATQAGIQINKAANGKLVYNQTGRADQSNIQAFNTIATPRAGSYELVLPDGTLVWLNSESSLRYPVQFNTNEREVELRGEAYFEVAHNAAMPFKVSTAGQTVTVLGTHFNIKAYADDDKMQTTLLQGSVNIANELSGQNKLLVPGKQAIITKGEGNIRLTDANTDQVMAWKNGYFIFDNEDIRPIMKLISRWYDVDVTYQLTRPAVRFGGTFSRSSNLEQLLKSFSDVGGVKFELKGRRVIVAN